MICFEVWVNGEKLCVAGIGDFGVLAAHITWSQSRPKEVLYDKSKWKPGETRLHVGGLVNKEHVRWLEQFGHLKIGDEVTFKIIESESADAPAHKYSSDDPEGQRKKRYEQYKLLKREFENNAMLEESDEKAARMARAKLFVELREEFDAEPQ